MKVTTGITSTGIGMDKQEIRSGIEALDNVLQGFRLGDNVVWQVDDLEDYRHFVLPFVQAAAEEGWPVVYLRFASHAPVLLPSANVEIVKFNPAAGFDTFTREVHQFIESRGPKMFYIFDNLSSLVDKWVTDESLANFFQVTCPYLFELHTVTYFALTSGHHAHGTVARIRDTTQVLLNVYHVKGQMYVHPIKVWNRYSPQMFLPHVAEGEHWIPLANSGEAAEVLGSARQSPLRSSTQPLDPWESVYQKLARYRASPSGLDETDEEQLALKREFIRMLIGRHPIFSRLAERYFSLDDLFAVRDRLIGAGRIGGKAAGMLLARRILASGDEPGDMELIERLEDHDSFYIGSDVFFSFLVNNDLFRLRLQLTRNSSLSTEEFKEVEQRFLAGTFSGTIREQFRLILDYYGQAPVIVRSSSLLEDSFGNAFAGKYRSIFCANQGDPKSRLEDFMQAIKTVYASALNPDALSYRRRRGLGENDEQMAILVQRVSGIPYRHFYFPALAGVAFSRNLYVWNDRIDPKQGLIRLVFGLGTRAVERVGADYPRMIAISDPHLRPEVGVRVAKYSQHEIDLLDLEQKRFTSRTLPDVLSNGRYPNLELFVSVMQDGYPFDPISTSVKGEPEQLVLTFNNLLHKTDFVTMMGKILRKLEDAYGQPVDVEFTAGVDEDERVSINLLQCRPLLLPGSTIDVSIPKYLEPERVLFRSQRMIGGGSLPPIRYILYIDPQEYNHLASIEEKRNLGRLVGQINRLPEVEQGKIIMMGPGRWGSGNIDLGVNIGYADIDNASVLVEMALEEAGHVPEVSYGTHFFQDLVEAQIIYMPVYPDDEATQFQTEFFTTAPNALLKLIPKASKHEKIVRLIDVPEAADGSYVRVVADSERNRAVCYLTDIHSR
jgi:pyruvate,water dikinase